MERVGVPYDVAPELVPKLRAACRPWRCSRCETKDRGEQLEAAGVEQDIQVVPDAAVLIEDVVSRADRSAAIDGLPDPRRAPPVGPVLVAHVSFTSPVVVAEVAGALRPAWTPTLILSSCCWRSARPTTQGRRWPGVAAQLDRPTWLVSAPTVIEVAAVIAAARWSCRAASTPRSWRRCTA